MSDLDPNPDRAIESFLIELGRRCRLTDGQLEELADHLHCDVGARSARGQAHQLAVAEAIAALGEPTTLAREYGRGRPNQLLLSENTMAAISAGHVTLFSRQLATLLEAGVPLAESCALIASGTNDLEMQRVVRDVGDTAQADAGFAGALRRYPDQFDDLFCRLVERAEANDALQPMMAQIAEYKEKTEGLRLNMQRCFNYTLAMTAACIGVLGVAIEPQSWSWLLGAAAVFFIGLAWARAQPGLRNRLDRAAYRLPIVGDLVHQAGIARFARTLSVAFAAGVPIADALTTARRTAHPGLADSLDTVNRHMEDGAMLAPAMDRSGMFPELAVRMVAVGESNGTLDVLLPRVAAFYEDRVQNALEGIANIMQPLLIGILCAIVSYLAITG